MTDNLPFLRSLNDACVDLVFIHQVSMRNRQIAIIVLTSNLRPSVTAQADAISEAIHWKAPKCLRQLAH